MTPALQPARHEFLLPIPSRVRRALRRQGKEEGIAPAELARRIFSREGLTAGPAKAAPPAPAPTVHTPPPVPAVPNGRTVTAKLTDRTFRRLEAAASKLGFTAGDLIRIGLQKVLKEVEAMGELKATARQRIPQPWAVS